jgi:hypothetical protein
VQSIPPYTTDVNSQYNIEVQVKLTNKPFYSSYAVTVSILESKLQSYIYGGSRMQAFASSTLL